MFRFQEIELHGWDLWPSFVVPLDAGVVVLSGPNGSGKTTFLDAIRQLLHAPQLSQKRRLTKYLRRPNQPALLRAVVTNRLDDRNRRPFDRQHVFTDEATIACALVPDGGTPEKRFVVLPGRVPASELQARLLEGKDWLGPDEYKRLLEYAGVSRSLMHILALEQGRADTLAEQKPTELFRWVMTARGSQQVLERYQAARRRFSDSLVEVTRQSQAVIRHQAELGELDRKIKRLEDHAERSDRLATAEKIAKASRYQALLQEQIAVDSKLPELRTKATNLATTLDRIARELSGDSKNLQSFQEEAHKAVEKANELIRTGDAAAAQAAALETDVKRLRESKNRLAEIPDESLDALIAEHRQAADEVAAARSALTELETRIRDLEERHNDLKRGVPRFPVEVENTIASLRAAGIEASLVADSVEVTDQRWSHAVESALADARYAVRVAAGTLARAIPLAQQHDFPGPIFEPSAGSPFTSSFLDVQDGGLAWLADWASEVRLVESDLPNEAGSVTHTGVRWDERGVWVRAAKEHVLGKGSLQRELARVEKELSDFRTELATRGAKLSTLVETSNALQERVALQRERVRLVDEIRDLDRIEASLKEAELQLVTTRRDRDQAVATSQQMARDVATAESALAKKRDGLSDREKELAGLRTAVIESETKLVELAPQIAGAKHDVEPSFVLEAEAGRLPQPTFADRDVDASRAALVKFLAEGPLPETSVVQERDVLRQTIEEFERHIAARQTEADRAQLELDHCRGDYLDVVRSTLHDYARRARALAEVASARIEIDQPHLENDDRVLDEAGISVRIGFDGKPPTELADPAHSGGQRVIAGLVLLMAMAETEGDSFFIVDEPFAHLSMDRVDDVGRFLRTSGAQFLITVPTTLDRGQLDPASLLVVLNKKKANDEYAKRPMVLRP